MEESFRFAALQHDLSTTGTVEFLGAVKREEVMQYLSQADLMIHGALEEGFCNAVIEAQAMELPVVCSDAGGLPENIEDGITGFVVPRRDAKAMAERIIFLLTNPEIRRKMGEAGRKRAIERFQIKDQIGKFSAMYESLAN